MKPYYYVIADGGGYPRTKFATLESAHEAAMTFAAKHPKTNFEILQCVGIAQTSGPQTFWMDGVNPWNDNQ